MKLSPTMIDALDMAVREGALHRYTGGRWAGPNAPRDRHGDLCEWFGTNTVFALVSRGLLRTAGWRDGQRSNNPNNYCTRVVRTDKPVA